MNKIIPNFHDTIFSTARFSSGCRISGVEYIAVYPRNGESSIIKNALIPKNLVKAFGKLRQIENQTFDGVLQILESGKYCKFCHIPLSEGKAILPAVICSDEGTCSVGAYQETPNLTKVMKCPKCGYSRMEK